MDYKQFQHSLDAALYALRKRNYHELSESRILNALAPLIESPSEPRGEAAHLVYDVLEKAFTQFLDQEHCRVATMYFLEGLTVLRISMEVPLSERTIYRYLKQIGEELAFQLWQWLRRSVADTNRRVVWETAPADPIEALEFLLREEFLLSAREVKIALLLAEPRTKWLKNSKLAEELDIVKDTLRTHLRHIYRKLGVHSRAEVAAKIAELTDSKVKRKSENETGKGHPEVAPRTSKDSRGFSSYPIVHRYTGSS